MKRAGCRFLIFTQPRCVSSNCCPTMWIWQNWQQRPRTTVVLSWRVWFGLPSPLPWTATSRSFIHYTELPFRVALSHFLFAVTTLCFLHCRIFCLDVVHSVEYVIRLVLRHYPSYLCPVVLNINIAPLNQNTSYKMKNALKCVKIHENWR